MDSKTVETLTDAGKATVIVAGHVGEMTGRAMQEASKTVGCPVGATVGKAVEAAGRAVSDTGVKVANRDRARLTGRRDTSTTNSKHRR
jgi:hypothetical protein